MCLLAFICKTLPHPVGHSSRTSHQTSKGSIKWSSNVSINQEALWGIINEPPVDISGLMLYNTIIYCNRVSTSLVVVSLVYRHIDMMCLFVSLFYRRTQHLSSYTTGCVNNLILTRNPVTDTRASIYTNGMIQDSQSDHWFPMRRLLRQAQNVGTFILLRNRHGLIYLGLNNRKWKGHWDI